MEVRTAHGSAEVSVEGPDDPAFLFVLTHGAGGGVDTRDLAAAGRAGLSRGAAVALVRQAYRVAGARAPGSEIRQDAAWLEVVGALRERFPGVPLIQGGRSNGARVACRTAQAAGARAVAALAFPLHPPGRPERSRAAELTGAGVDVLVVNGDRDPFGVPEGTRQVRVVTMPGETHALSRHPAEVERVVGEWLSELLAARR